MRTVNVYLSGNRLHDFVLNNFYDGISDCEKRLLTVNDYKSSDVAVVFGTYKTAIPVSWARGEIIARQRIVNADVVVIDSGYIKRGEADDSYYAVGLNGLNGGADFRNANSPNDRWDALDISLREWRHDGEHIILCGQVPWDASVQHTDHIRWLYDTATDIKQYSNKPVVYRPHPKAIGRMPSELPFCRTSVGPLMTDLETAYCTVAYNSNSCVESVIEGVPAVICGVNDMLGNIAARRLHYVASPPKPDRKQWAYNLAYTQWTPREMRDGLAWKHLFR